MKEHMHVPLHHSHHHYHFAAYYVGSPGSQWQLRPTSHDHPHDHAGLTHQHPYTTEEETALHEREAHIHEH